MSSDDARTPTQIRRAQQYRDRWTSFGGSTGIIDISEKPSPTELRTYPIFKDFDDKFLDRISPDVSIARWQAGSIIFEEGSYVDLAFFVVDGTLDLFLSGVEGDSSAGRPIFDTHRTMTYEPPAGEKEAAPRPERTMYQTQIDRQPQGKNELVFLSVMDANLPSGQMVTLRSGEMFGEIGALSGWPQSATVRTSTDCTLIQIRIPALRLMKRRSKALKKQIDSVYRERSLLAQLKATPLLGNCDDAFLSQLKERVELVSCEPDQVIVTEGEEPDAVYLVRSGFVKLSQRVGDEPMAVSYLSKGMTLGEAELLLRLNGSGRWHSTASSVEYSELVKIPSAEFQNILAEYPSIEKRLWKTAIGRVKESGYSRKNVEHSEFIDTALTSGLVQGNSILVIDLNTCTRCDDCVRACAETHGGLPRFVREGNKYKNHLFTRACYHCRDPLCLVGCPTGAIHRTNVGDVVAIDENICIGCSSCANNCPYDAITMFETGQKWPQDMVPEALRGTDRLLATKCDHCYTSSTGPACVNNCPHGCAVRVGSIEEFQKLTSGDAEGMEGLANIKPSRLVSSPPWFVAFLAAIAVCLLVLAANAMVTDVRPTTTWGQAYGIAAAALLVLAGLYGMRRRMIRFTRRVSLGRSRNWVHFHVYSGTVFLLLVFMHTGFRVPTGTLTTWLWWLSIWLTLSGMLGIALQRWIPRLLTSGLATEVHYDRIPELVGELKARAEELMTDADRHLRRFYAQSVAPALVGPSTNLLYYVDISGGLKSRTRQFDYLRRFVATDEKVRVDQLQNIYHTKLELDAHYTLQKALRWWSLLHIPVALIALVLMVAHVYAVLYY